MERKGQSSQQSCEVGEGINFILICIQSWKGYESPDVLQVTMEFHVGQDHGIRFGYNCKQTNREVGNQFC